MLMTPSTQRTARALAAALCLFLGVWTGCATVTPPKSRDPAELLSSGPTRSAVQQASFQAPDPQKKAAETLKLEDFSPDNIGKTTKKLTGYGPNRDRAYQLFGEAEAEYKRGAELTGSERTAAFNAAAAKFNQAAESWPDSALQQDALFYAGESFFFTDQYTKANEAYEKLVKAFPNNRHMDIVDQRRFTIAQWWLDETEKKPESWWQVNVTDQSRPWRDTRGHALRIFDKIRVDDPTGRLADDATLAAGNAQFKKGDYIRADEFYSDLRKNYPNSEHQFNAHFLGLKAKLLSYQGSSYAGAALDEGEKLVRQIRRQFPRDYEQEREFVDRAYAEIRFRKAEREFDRGSYYERRGENRAASLYYQTVVNSFADTPLAQKAENRLAAIQGRPAVPVQQAPWLVKLFPEPDKIKPVVEAAAVNKETIQR